ncbi:HNH endonuclease [Flammeovirga sp. OC4]|uniref:HNH endonuclease n=1 Tax=Flammeovirga sp. OC4 TaxID=1382345 RepID=UPI000693E4CB|nr:hypothetical protein [Flammeovirga sp. OC4]
MIKIKDCEIGDLYNLIEPFFKPKPLFSSPRNKFERISNLITNTNGEILIYNYSEMIAFNAQIEEIIFGGSQINLDQVKNAYRFLSIINQYPPIHINRIADHEIEYKVAFQRFNKLVDFCDFNLEDGLERNIRILKGLNDDEISYKRRAEQMTKAYEAWCVKNQLYSINKKKLKRGGFLNKIYEIFDYENFSKSKGYEFVKSLNLPVCPYCNRQYISIEGNDKLKGTRPDIDHFFPKSKYPYFALSIYNLIPSCKVCNSSFKGAKDFFILEHIHPYFENFGSGAVFKMEGETETYFNNVNQFNLKLINSHTEKEKVENSNHTFKLENLYDNNHKDYALEIYQKAEAYPEDYLKSLEGVFNKPIKDNIRLLIGNYISKNDFSKRPLSKLTRDLFDQFELWVRWKIDKSDFDKE